MSLSALPVRRSESGPMKDVSPDVGIGQRHLLFVRVEIDSL